MTRYWCGVASRDHIRTGIAGGFCQAGHGKKAPLARMSEGDGIVFYSPVIRYGGKERCQKFTAIGRVAGAQPYQREMSPGFVPYRRDVRFFDGLEPEIHTLLEALEFTRGRANWGYKFRFGHFELSESDFLTIARAMLPDSWCDAFPEASGLVPPAQEDTGAALRVPSGRAAEGLPA